jgi:glutamine phosphoribosylpyrophosphate amidotransferase
MCAIFGSFDRSMYDVLFEVNNARGNFAYSHCFINSKPAAPFHIKKFNKIPKINDIPDVSSNVYHFGHFQAPTSSVRAWKENTSHPFEHGDWIVAHNGVLTNFEELAAEYAPKENIKVDSALIPLMLSNHTLEIDTKLKDESMIENAIKTVLEKIKGTFALYIINRKHKRAFIARQGSTLFANTSTGSFCSVECKSEGWSELSEGYIYEVIFKAKCIAPFAKFSIDSPFLFIQEEEDI